MIPMGQERNGRWGWRFQPQSLLLCFFLASTFLFQSPEAVHVPVDDRTGTKEEGVLHSSSFHLYQLLGDGSDISPEGWAVYLLDRFPSTLSVVRVMLPEAVGHLSRR